MSIPAKLSFGVLGSNSESITVDLSNIWNTTTGGYEQGNADAYLVRYMLTIAGSTYTITDSDTGTVVFQN